jgi:hypothetical protein
MAAASLDVNFKEELSAIEQCKRKAPMSSPAGELTSATGFKVLSEAERTAALYSLLQHSTQVQIRFFITVLQQMARSDPMTALLSPAVGGKSVLALATDLLVTNSSSRLHAEPDGGQTCEHESQVAWSQINHAQLAHHAQLQHSGQCQSSIRRG